MKKKVLYLSIIILSIFVYAFAFLLVVTYKPSYEYSMFYKKKLTKYWAGENSMTIDTNKKMLFCYDLNPVDLSSCKAEQANLQFVGKSTKTKEENNQLQYIYGNRLSIYWQWNDKVDFEQISVSVKIKATDYFNVKINNQDDVNINPSSSDFDVVTFNLKYKKQNEITFSSNQEMQIVEICFS